MQYMCYHFLKFQYFCKMYIEQFQWWNQYIANNIWVGVGNTVN